MTDADYVALDSVQGLLAMIFDAAMRLIPADQHPAFIDETRRVTAQLESGKVAAV